MAGKRIAATAINWQLMGERVPPHQRGIFLQFKAKSDNYLRRMLEYPEQPPAIDWDKYKCTVTVPGMVEDFQKQYECLEIPYPDNPKCGELDALEKETIASIETFKKESDVRMASYQKELDRIKALVPIEDMTMDEFKDAYPDLAIDPINKPTFWPHTPEDQLGYHEKLAAEEKKKAKK